MADLGRWREQLSDAVAQPERPLCRGQRGGDGSSLFGGGSLEVNGGLALHGAIDWQAGMLGGTVTVYPDGVITGSTALNHFFWRQGL